MPKFKDIPQLIVCGEWECNFGMERLVNKIEQMEREEENKKMTLKEIEKRIRL